jgi:hypothetical protein
MDLKGIGLQVADWILVTQDTDLWWVFVNTVMNIQVP